MPSRPEDRPVRTLQEDLLDLEWGAYWIVRFGLAGVGLLLILFFVGGSLLPDRYYSEGSPPTLWTRLMPLAVGLTAAAPMVVPNRLTLRGRPFRVRLALSIIVGLCGVCLGVIGIAAGLRDGENPAIYPASILLILIGLSAPGSLLWRRRLTRISTPAGPGPSATGLVER